jgi:hypothetical protein
MVAHLEMVGKIIYTNRVRATRLASAGLPPSVSIGR